MPKKLNGKTVYFPKVAEARQALAEKALDLYNQYEDAIKLALAAGEYEVALDNFKFLILHMPKHEGQGIVDTSVDKSHAVKATSQVPTIQIGFSLGGIPEPKALPATEVIDVTPKKEEDDV